MDIIFIILRLLLWPVVIIGIIFYLAKRKGRRESGISKKDSMGQLFILLSVAFFGVTLVNINRNIGEVLSVRSIILITLVVAFAITYVYKVVYILPFALVGVFIWWGLQAIEWVELVGNIKPSAAIGVVGLMALSYYCLGLLHKKSEKYKNFYGVYLSFGLAIVTIGLFWFSTKIGLRSFGDMTQGVFVTGSLPLLMSLLFAAATFGFLSTALIQKKLVTTYEFMAIIFLGVFVMVLAFLPEQSLFGPTGFGRGIVQPPPSYRYYDQLNATGIVWAIIFNLTIFFEFLGLILSGYSQRETWPINFGVVGLSLLIIAKYFDWFFTFLDKSLFFIGAGILMFGIGWFMEKGRKKMLADIKKEIA